VATGGVHIYSYDELKALWIKNGGSAAWAPTMAGIAKVESGGNPTATNPSGATGLWQVEVPGSSSGQTQAQMLNPDLNAKQAVTLLGNGSGIENWGHGSTWNSGDGLGNAVQNSGSKPWTEAEVLAFLATNKIPTSGGTGAASKAGQSFSPSGTYIGAGGWLVGLDNAFNPTASGGSAAEQILTLGTSDVVAGAANTVQIFFIRGVFVVLSIGVIAVGAKIAFGVKPVHAATGLALGSTAEGRGVKRLFGGNADRAALANSDRRQAALAQNAELRDQRARAREQLRSQLRMNEQRNRATEERRTNAERETARRKTAQFTWNQHAAKAKANTRGGSSRGK
jgi:hypothetical protein